MKKVLIIDPDTRFRKSFCSLLSPEGYTIEASKCLTDAIQKMTRECYHCVVMDVNLPELKGYEAVSILKNMDPKIRVIMTAEKNTIRLETKVRNQDIYYYFIKSFGLDELKAAIDNIFPAFGEEGTKMEKTFTKGKILVIDDDPDFREAVTLILKSAHYEVVAANNPNEGKEKLLSEKPHLILLDIMMDSLFDGYALCNDIKTTEKFKDFNYIPIIFVSAVKEISGSRFAFDAAAQGLAGPDDYIDKPVNPDDLLARIDKFLKK